MGGPNQQWRSSRHVAVEEGQQWNNLHPDCDRCVFETSLVRSTKDDNGTELLNRPLQKLLKEHGVHHFATHNDETKASILERLNRTLKKRK